MASSSEVSTHWPSPVLLPRLQRRQHADGEIEAGADVGDGERDAIGRAVLRAGHRHQARHRLDHEIEAAALGVGPGLAEARDRAQDQPRIARVQRAPSRRPSLSMHAGTEILQHHVGAVDQVPEDLEVGGALRSSTDAALVAVPQHEGRALALDEGRRAADRIALRAFDLDHVGAHVGELHAAERTRQMRRQVEDHQPVERAHAIYSPNSFLRSASVFSHAEPPNWLDTIRAVLDDQEARRAATCCGSCASTGREARRPVALLIGLLQVGRLDLDPGDLLELGRGQPARLVAWPASAGRAGSPRRRHRSPASPAAPRTRRSPITVETRRAAREKEGAAIHVG